MPIDLEPAIRHAVEQEVGSTILDWSPRSAGLTHANAGVASFADGSRRFVKAATNAHSAAEVRNEIAMLTTLEAPFLPEVLGILREPTPILLLEDLSHGHWPEPYPQDVSALQKALDELRTLPVPEELDLPELTGPSAEIISAVVDHAASAAPDLVPWLAASADAIVDAAARPSPGHTLVHADLWYSNLCFLDDRVVIIDWSHARVGSPWFDASTVGIDLVIEGRRPLPMRDAAKWAGAHLAWALWALAEGPGPGISDPGRWRLDNLELVDGAAWWIADELDLPVPPVLTDRTPGYR